MLTQQKLIKIRKAVIAKTTKSVAMLLNVEITKGAINVPYFKYIKVKSSSPTDNRVDCNIQLKLIIIITIVIVIVI